MQSEIKYLQYMKVRQIFVALTLAFLLFSLTIYNSQFVNIRIILVAYFTLIPILILILIKAKSIHASIYGVALNSIAWLVYIIFWVILNIEQLEIDLAGPAVEMLTPILSFTLPLTLIIFRSISPETGVLAIKYFFRIVIVFLVSEMFVRYFFEPECFLNYSCRFEAKTVGFFSTTNVLGTSLAIILIALMISGKFNHIFKVLLIILITTMARAAIIGFLLIFILNRFLIIKSKVLKYYFLLFSLITIFTYIIFDPLNLFDDGSGLSKIQFFHSSYIILNSSNIFNILFGFGANYHKIISILDVNGWSPHAPVLKSFLYFGLVGVFLFIHNLYSIARIGGGMVWIVLTVTILGLAGAPIFIPTLTVGAVILIFSNKL